LYLVTLWSGLTKKTAPKAERMNRSRAFYPMEEAVGRKGRNLLVAPESDPRVKDKALSGKRRQGL